MFPALPGKIYINNFDEQKIQKRMQQIEVYLNHLLSDFRRHEAISFVHDFIELQINEQMKLNDLTTLNFQFTSKTEMAYI